MRWSARRKEEVVLRLLRGESLDALARESGQPAGRISAWREEFLAAGREGLKSRPARWRTVGWSRRSARSASCRWSSTSCGRSTRRWTAALPGRGAERRRTAGAPAGPGLPGRGGLQVGGVRAAPPTQHLGARAPVRRRPGPLGAMPDDELLRAIRREIDESPFVGEGHRKITARLRRRGICTSRKRVLRLTRGPGCWPRRRRCASAPGACTTARSPSTSPTRCGRPTPPRAGAPPTGAARCSRSSTTPPARRGSTPRRGWIAGPPPTCSARSAPSASARSSRPSPPAWRCATTAGRASAPTTTRPRSTTSASLARRPTTTSPRPTAASRSFLQHVKEQVLWIERFETLRGPARRRARLQPHAQRALAARAPPLPHARPSARAPAPSGRRGMIAAFTTQVSGEPGAGHSAGAGSGRVKIGFLLTSAGSRLVSHVTCRCRDPLADGAVPCGG